MTKNELLEKAIKDVGSHVVSEDWNGTVIHEGRQNSVVRIKNNIHDLAVRYRTALEFWYEDIVKEPLLVNMGIKRIPIIHFSQHIHPPATLITDYIDGNILQNEKLSTETAKEIGNLLAEIHLPTNGSTTFLDFSEKKISDRNWISDFLKSLYDIVLDCGFSSENAQSIKNEAEIIFVDFNNSNLVLVHNDFHLKNILRDLENRLWIIDWDSASIAPKEKDFVKLFDWSLSEEGIFDTIVETYCKKTKTKFEMKMFHLFRVFIVNPNFIYTKKA